MNLFPRKLVYLTAAPAALALFGWVGAEQDAAQPVAPANSALNHWVFLTKDVSQADVRSHAWNVIEHMTAAHPTAHFSYYENFSEVDDDELHVLLESADSEAQQAFLAAYGQDDVCRAQIALEDERLAISRDVYLRLIASDPEKERGRREVGLVTWSLEARFTRLAEAAECIESVVEHLNATYPEACFRGYEEWNPHASALHIYIYVSGVPLWESVDARIRRDPVFRELMEGAEDAFVAGSFEDAWHNLLAK
jgi:hypothetical protein